MKLKKAGMVVLFTLSLSLAFLLGVKFTLDNQKIVTTGGTAAKSSVLCYQKEYYVNPNFIKWGIVVD